MGDGFSLLPIMAYTGRDTFFRFQVYQRVGVSLIEFRKGQGHLSLQSLKGLAVKKARKLSGFVIYSYIISIMIIMIIII